MEKYVADCINMEQDILPHKMVLLIAGVGAGKNTWVRNNLLKNYKVLFITSRRGTVNAELDRANSYDDEGNMIPAKRVIDIPSLTEKERHKCWGKVSKCMANIITTNAYMAQFAENVYDESNPKTHLWKYFDFVVIDEVHSLTTDATFTDSSFHVKAFLEKALRETKNLDWPKIVFMTGTPQPVSWLQSEKNKRLIHEIDLRGICRDVSPIEICIAPKKYAFDRLIEEYEKNKRIVYFINHISCMNELVTFLGNNGIPEEAIGISFSSGDRIDQFSTVLQMNKKRTEDYLREKECLPPDIKVLITTSKNKEGINIFNDDIETVYTESHSLCDIKQLAGRVRTGAKRVCIIKDAKKFAMNESDMEWLLNVNCLDDVNMTLNRINNQNSDQVEELINMTHEKFRYIRYNYFKKKFERYVARRHQEKIEHNDSQAISQYYDNYFNDTGYYYGNGHTSSISDYFKVCKCYEYKPLYEIIDDYLHSRDLVDKPFPRSKKDGILRDCNNLIAKYSNSFDGTEYRKLGALLKKYGYTHKDTNEKGKPTKKLKIEAGYTVISKTDYIGMSRSPA